MATFFLDVQQIFLDVHKKFVGRPKFFLDVQKSFWTSKKVSGRPKNLLDVQKNIFVRPKNLTVPMDLLEPYGGYKMDPGKVLVGKCTSTPD